MWRFEGSDRVTTNSSHPSSSRAGQHHQHHIPGQSSVATGGDTALQPTQQPAKSPYDEDHRHSSTEPENRASLHSCWSRYAHFTLHAS